MGGILSNGSAEGVAAFGLATTAVPFVRAVSMVLIVSQLHSTPSGRGYFRLCLALKDGSELTIVLDYDSGHSTPYFIISI